MIRFPGPIYTILRRWGFGPHFLQWVSSLYNHPQAYVKYSGFRSDSFQIQRGKRQGCPLSPLIFALVIEPLAALIRTSPDIKGLEIASTSHKLCLLADDALLFVTSPRTTLPNLIRILEKFASITGLEVNQSKSKALNVSLPQTEFIHLQDHFPFLWSTSSIPYLGIKLTGNPASLYQANDLPMLSYLTSLLDAWRPLCVSWLGRVAAVKMSLLPKLLYLYRSLFPPTSIESFRPVYFSTYGAPLNQKVPRSVLHSKLSGGLGIPNFARYYHAAQLAQITLLHAKIEISLWVSLEAIELTSLVGSN